jgi:ribosomal protein L21E
MPAIKEGDRVRIKTRETTPEDVKSGLYYSHFAGLTGTVYKIYSKEEVTVEIETESLTREVRQRHEKIRDQMKSKWLDGLSEEGRSKLTDREKDFLLRYMVLTGLGDLEKIGPRPVIETPVTATVPEPSTSDSGNLFAEQAVLGGEAVVRRATSADLEAAEEAELRKHQRGE